VETGSIQYRITSASASPSKTLRSPTRRTQGHAAGYSCPCIPVSLPSDRCPTPPHRWSKSHQATPSFGFIPRRTPHRVSRLRPLHHTNCAEDDDTHTRVGHHCIPNGIHKRRGTLETPVHAVATTTLRREEALIWSTQTLLWDLPVVLGLFPAPHMLSFRAGPLAFCELSTLPVHAQPTPALRRGRRGPPTGRSLHRSARRSVATARSRTRQPHTACR
jgi:hypothetical protein